MCVFGAKSSSAVHIHVQHNALFFQLPTTNLNRGQDTRAIAIAARRHNTILARDRAAHDGADCVRACLVHVGTASPGTLQRTSVQPAQTLPPSRHGRRIRTFSRAATPPPQVPPPTPTGRSRFLTQQHRAQPPHARALPSSPLAARPRRTRPSCAARAGESGARPPGPAGAPGYATRFFFTIVRNQAGRPQNPRISKGVLEHILRTHSSHSTGM